jgi:hypothetical protein
LIGRVNVPGHVNSPQARSSVHNHELHQMSH